MSNWNSWLVFRSPLPDVKQQTSAPAYERTLTGNVQVSTVLSGVQVMAPAMSLHYTMLSNTFPGCRFFEQDVKFLLQSTLSPQHVDGSQSASGRIFSGNETCSGQIAGGRVKDNGRNDL